jgi:hypothetical protein
MNAVSSQQSVSFPKKALWLLQRYFSGVTAIFARMGTPSGAFFAFAADNS